MDVDYVGNDIDSSDGPVFTDSWQECCKYPGDYQSNDVIGKTPLERSQMVFKLKRLSFPFERPC